MLPLKIAIVDSDVAFCERLTSMFEERGTSVAVLCQASDLLACHDAFAFDSYVISASLVGVDSIQLINILRRRTSAGIIVVVDKFELQIFDAVISCGADMLIGKDSGPGHVELAIMAVNRRCISAVERMNGWQLDRIGKRLVWPDGSVSLLGSTDVAVLQSFVGTDVVVTRAQLCECLGIGSVESCGRNVNPIVYRLRRRLERDAPLALPLQTRPRVGYVFRGQLRLI